MLKILKPLIGIHAESMGNITFDMTLDEVKRLLGEPSKFGHPLSPFYDHLGIRMELDSHEQLVSFFFGKSANIQLYGINPLGLPAEEVIKLLEKASGHKAKKADRDHSYVFSDIGIKLWRHTLPDEIKKMIGKTKEYPDEAGKTWVEEDVKKAEYFDLIYLTQKGHYDTRS